MSITLSSSSNKVSFNTGEINNVITNTNPEFFKSTSTLGNSHSTQSIPRAPSKHRRSNSSSKQTNNNYLAPDPNANFVYFLPHEKDSHEIQILKKSYENRVNKLMENLKNCVSNITSMNINEVLNEYLYQEKEKVISDLYEQNAIIQREYDENKIEMHRLQKIISVLEIDLNKTQNQLKEIRNLNHKLTEQNMQFQVQNFDLNVKLSTLNADKEKESSNEIISCQKENIELKQNIQELNQIIEKLKNDYEQTISNLQTKYNTDLQEQNDKIKSIQSFNIELQNKIDELKQTIILKENQIHSITNDKDDYILRYEQESNLQNQIIILLKSKISSIKTDFNTFKQEAFDELTKIRQYYETIINRIIYQIDTFAQKNNKYIIEEKVKAVYEKQLNAQFEKAEKYFEENKQLFYAQQDNIQTINNLQTQINSLHLEVKGLQNKNQKLRNELLEKNKQKTNNIASKELSNKIKIEIEKIKDKYLNIIQMLKEQITQLAEQLKNINTNMNANISNNNDKIENEINNNNNDKLLIKQLQQKNHDLMKNQDEYVKIIKKKEKQIKDLQNALSQSFHSISSGMKNIKMANKLDLEVKQILKKSKKD